MNVGIVSIWCNRGQATVARHIRSIFDGLGYRTFILARPVRSKASDTPVLMNDVWDQKDVTQASSHEIPMSEYRDWVRKNSIDAIFCDQNYQFQEIERLRLMGVMTIGRFVWEKFSSQHIKKAKKAFEIIYSMTGCEQNRYKTMGIESPKVDWGCHPEITGITAERPKDEFRIFFPASGMRKPVGIALEAFGKAGLPEHTKLILKSQEIRSKIDLGNYNVDTDPRIRWVTEDLDFEDYHKLFASAHICYCPSRWEGLGLHLYEAIAHGVPVISNDIPPINEIITNGFNGILVRSREAGLAKSGIPAYDPVPEDLVKALEESAGEARLQELIRNTLRRRDEMPWSRTISQFKDLLEGRK